MATQTIERPAADLAARFPGRYLSVTSFRADGTGVATPVWFVTDGERLFALTDLQSAKIRRLRRNPFALVASCRADGKLRHEPVPAHVSVLTATRELERVRTLLLGRYPISYPPSTSSGGHGVAARPKRRDAVGLQHGGEVGEAPEAVGSREVSGCAVRSAVSQAGLRT
jgi:PPOX class probable F420-dependent enzyme